MIGGPLDPRNIAAHAIQFSPAGARFVLECCIERGIKLDGDTVLLLREIGKQDRPKWEPPSADEIARRRMESRGIAVPEPRRIPSVEVHETETVPEDELGEEKPL